MLRDPISHGNLFVFFSSRAFPLHAWWAISSFIHFPHAYTYICLHICPLIPNFPFPAVESGRNPRINSPLPRWSATDCRSALSTRRNRSTQRRVDATLKTVQPSPHPIATLHTVPRVCLESDGGDIRSRVNLWNKRREETDPECGRSTSRAAGVDVKKKKGKRSQTTNESVACGRGRKMVLLRD